jgi:hypothetical protein
MVRLGAGTLQAEPGGAGTPAFDNLNILPVSSSFSASRLRMDSGQSTTLTWSSTNATSCVTSEGWDGSKALSGSQDVSPTVSTTYTLTWQGEGGEEKKRITVQVLPGAPTTTI